MSVLLVLVALAPVACAEGTGGGAGSEGATPAEGVPRVAGSSAGPAADGEGSAGSGDLAASSSASSSSAQESGQRDGGDAELPGFEGEKIVKTAELGLGVADVRESASAAQRAAARFGGSVSSSRVDGGEGGAELVLSVPSPEFEAALDELRALGEVKTDTVNGEDVTEEFVDLRSRERNLLAAEASLLRLYDRAESVEDTLAIERELTGLREGIELVQGRLQYLEDRTTTSRISLTLRPVEKPLEEPPAWKPARDAARAWNASLAFLGAVAGGLVSAVVFGWWLAPALVAVAVWWWRRPRRAGPAPGP